MKFLVVGLGSMGKRRIRNLKQLSHNNIIGFDPRNDRCKESHEKYGISTFIDISMALKERPDAMIISTPPDLHMHYAKIAINNKIHFFTEASVVQEEMDEIIQKLKNSDVIGSPSCTMRYHPIILKVNELMNSNIVGNPLTFLYHSGQYLPDWHPWEDYRTFYVSKRKTGACREIVPFELIWIISTFGKISGLIGTNSKISKLDTDIDDIYSILLEFKNGIRGNLTVDVIARYAFRQLKILGENGVILADWSDKTVKYFTKESGWNTIQIDDGKIEKNYIHGDGPYVEEMANFIKTIKKEISQSYTFEDDLVVLKILESIETSNKLGMKQVIDM